MTRSDLLRCAAAAACIGFAAAAPAQPPAPTGAAASAANDRAAGPTAAAAASAPAARSSAFAGYRRFTDAPAAGWRDANDLTARIGGWRAYAREAAASSQAGRDAGGVR